MHDRSMFGRAGLVPARATALVSACVSMMVGCHPVYAQQSSQASPVLLASDAARTPAANPSRASRVGVIDSLREPESVLYDRVRDVFYISNMDGAPSAKDGAGFITKLRGDGTREDLRWIDGGRNGVTLHAPTGMAIVGDVLWIADIDVVRAFDALTGAPIAEIDLAPFGGRLLTHVTVGPDHGVYVTSTTFPADTGTMDAMARDRIFRVELNGHVSVGSKAARPKQPGDTLLASLFEFVGDVENIEWDARRGLLYVPLTTQNRVDIFRVPRQ